MNYTIRDATKEDIDKMLPLIPRLADFEIPAHRTVEEVWAGDADLLKQWGEGNTPDCFVKIAVDAHQAILGVAIVRVSLDFFSRAPDAYLEVIVVAPQADGQGVGKALIAEVERVSREEHKVQSMSLGVFVNNKRARHVYEQLGFSAETMRYVKLFD